MTRYNLYITYQIDSVNEENKYFVECLIGSYKSKSLALKENRFYLKYMSELNIFCLLNRIDSSIHKTFNLSEIAFAKFDKTSNEYKKFIVENTEALKKLRLESSAEELAFSIENTAKMKIMRKVHSAFDTPIKVSYNLDPN
jgi:phosphatidate phosphatase PAH1